MTARAKCARCDHETYHRDYNEAADALWNHYQQAHTTTPPAAVVQQHSRGTAQAGRSRQRRSTHPRTQEPSPGADEVVTDDKIPMPRELLEALADPDECWFDHHGGCQAHGYLSLEQGQECPQHELKRRLSASTGGPA